ncbi:MAG: hypothetical protein ISR98_00850 [Parcubacteria group bacterium]|nr:hypothetical protein [Parcubacteria group bacterium]
MRNLLSQKDKKVIINEYKLRIIIIVLTAIFLTTLIAGTLLVPSYILSNFKFNIIKEHAEIIKKSVEKREQSGSGLILNDTQQKLNILSISEDNVLLSTAFRKILDKRPSGIKINELFYKKQQDNSGAIITSGVASKRDILLQFEKDLKKENIFSEVVLPISNLASDRNIEFSISIKGKF